MPKKELKTLHSEESKLGPNAERFTKFLENGLHCFDECLTDFRPTYVQHEKQGIGLLFTQLREDDWGIDPATDYAVIAFEHGISWPSGSLIYFNNEQPPEQVAMLFVAAIVRETPVNCPACKQCITKDIYSKQLEKDWKEKKDWFEQPPEEFIPGFHD